MILYFLLSIVIFLIVVEVITVLFKLTGLSEEKARFQVISLLTGSGFTTKEAELITQHPS
jgi:Trk-type K+ transport system membrane component